MAGQAGWYRAPGEEGLLRYWNGSAWTEHRQPDPAAVPPQPHSTAAETDPMAEYERQFDSSSPVDLHNLDLPSFNFDQRSFDAPTPGAAVSTTAPGPTPSPAPQPLVRPQTALGASTTPSPAHEFAGAPASVPRSFAPRPAPAEFAPLGSIAVGATSVAPIALPASFADAPTVAEPRSEFEQVLRESEMIVVAAKPPVQRAPLAIAAPTARPIVGSNRQRVVSAARGMGIAILVILTGIGAMAFFSVQSLAGPGEQKTTGIVTSLGSTTGNSCAPIARFAVTGRPFTAEANTAITPCPVGLGQDVDIIYTASNPASSAHIQLGSSVAQYLWAVPVLGFLFFVAALIAFVVRAGSIASGIRLLREGRGKPKGPAEAV